MPAPVVVTGAAGLLGRAIVREIGARRPIVALTRRDLDITRDDDVSRRLSEIRPAAVINCAAYNDVDAAEDHPHQALDVNAFGVRALARAAADAGAAFVHYSSDFVFAGTGSQPYTEEDGPEPQSVYAASKLLGEWFALEAPEAYVLRVESLFGATGPGRRSSLDAIVAGIAEEREVPVFTDRTVSPSYVVDVARATATLLDTRPTHGLYHCVNTGTASWRDVALEAGRLLGRDPRLKGITLAEVSLRAARPQYCALSNAKLAVAGVVMPTWQDALERYLLSVDSRQ